MDQSFLRYISLTRAAKYVIAATMKVLPTGCKTFSQKALRATSSSLDVLAGCLAMRSTPEFA